MSEDIKIGRYLVLLWLGLLLGAVLLFLWAMSGGAKAEDYPCPAKVKSCKVLVITPDEEQSLDGPNMIFDHALWANRANFTDLIAAWRAKLKSAPAGTVAKPEEPKK